MKDCDESIENISENLVKCRNLCDNHASLGADVYAPLGACFHLQYVCPLIKRGPMV